jgi:hypothetical protein
MEYQYNEYPSIRDGILAVDERYTMDNSPRVIPNIYPANPMRYSITVPILSPEARREKGFDAVCMNMIDYMNVSYNSIYWYIKNETDASIINQVYTTCSNGLSLTVPDIETAKIHIMDMVNFKFLVFNELLRVIFDQSYTPFRSIFPELYFKCILTMIEEPLTHNYFKLTNEILSHLKDIFKKDICGFIQSLIPDEIKLAKQIYATMDRIQPARQVTHFTGLARGARSTAVTRFIGIIDELNTLYHDTIQTEISRRFKPGAEPGAEDKPDDRGAEDKSGGRRTKRKLFLKYKKRKSFRNSFSSRPAFT